MSNIRPTRQELLDGLAEMQALGQGVWEIECFADLALPGLIAESLVNPTGKARDILRVFESVALRVSQAPKHAPLLCLTCNSTFPDFTRMPAFLVILKPSHPTVDRVMVQGICRDCSERYQDDAALQQAIIAALGHYTGMEIRRFTSHPPGNA
jgi:hypothetical protein